MSKVDENRDFVEKEIFEVKMDQWKGRVWKKKSLFLDACVVVAACSWTRKPFVNLRAGQEVERLGVDDQVVLEVVEGLARVGAERVGRGEGQTGGKE